MSLESVLNEIEQKSFSLRDKGTKFEVLIKNWFLTTRLYCDNIDKIWLWDEFLYKDQFGGSDSGIDLVILTKESEFIAVQCKFYSSTASIDKADVDTFISTSAKIFEHDGEKTKFSGRLFISTTNNWSKKADELIQNQEIPVNRISLNTLKDSGVDWNKLYAGMIGTKARQEKKTIRDHQQNALKKVNEHFKYADRGKLIMACGTGKTFTSLKIAENETNGNGLILFLVPSIALLGQTLREWTNDVSEEFYPICICSDPKISRTSSNDDNGMSVVDLALPATTNVDKIVEQLENIKKQKGLKVIFSTYQSIDVILDAQKQLMTKDSKFGTFDLVICDEAHRTTGVILPGEEESNFTKIHNNEFIKAKKRLYMTATPRLYDDNSKSKAEQNNACLCSMDDRSIYGDEIYRIGFGEAVQRGLLTDYKVLILTLNHGQVPKALIANEDIEFKIDDVSKLMGCINGLSKQILDKEGIVKSSDPDPMKRAVAFCRDIKISKKITSDLNEFSDTYISSLKPEVQDKMVEISSKHIDGSMNALQREELLSWLKEDSDNSKECKILTNARCLSEGVDVPTLDAVLFLSAKNSQVDVVQSVGRVMRRAPGKKYGYIIIPVVIPADKKPEEALNDNDTYRVVWSVLNALRAHDDRFNAEVNKIDLNKRKPKNILIGTVDNTGKEKKYKGNNFEINDSQLKLDMDINKLQNAIYAKMVEKVGDRKYFETWAKDVAQIAEIQIDKIRDLIKRDKEYKKAFDKFIAGLQSNVSPDIDTEQGIEMLSQHIITKPIFEALFEGYSFVNSNPISRSMQDILDLLLKGQIEKETEELNKFYEDVKLKIGDIDNAEGKQKIIVELYDKFFRTAFPKLVEQLGIVYTPVEVVDFIINSVEEILKKEFKRSITEENVNILDPFTGTGTFISRLLQSGLIKNKDLRRKYSSEIFANEIVLLAYYIATVNIENVYHDLQRKNISKDIGYSEFNGICLTDTFQLGEDDQEIQMFDQSFKENSERVNRQKKAPLQVIIGNPPYSIGQKSANDGVPNKVYQKLENRIKETYVKNSKAKLDRASYDSYIKAFRWASDRLSDAEEGIIGFITNNGIIEKGSLDGFRQTIQEEFSKIYILDLKGSKTAKNGDLAKREGENIFSIMTGVCIIFLLKNKKHKGKGKIFYKAVDNYLSKNEKFQYLRENTMLQTNAIEIFPNEKNDWINQRSSKFDTFIPLIDRKNKDNFKTFFNIFSNGVVTNRDAWVYSFSKTELEKNMLKTINFYNNQIDKIKKQKNDNENVDLNEALDTNLQSISWSADLRKKARNCIKDIYNPNEIRKALYRPFIKQNLYFSRHWIERYSQQYRFSGVSIFTSGTGNRRLFSLNISNLVIDLNAMDAGSTCYPMYYTEETKNATLFSNDKNKKEGISDFIYNLAKEKYGVPRISKEDIFYYVYGFLHNPDYREEFEADLKKDVPRLPLVDDYEDFKSYSNIGRELADLHLNYEKLDRPKEVIVEGEETGNYEVKKMKFIKKGKQDTIIYNKDIKIKNIPLTAYEYQVNGKSAIEWIMDRYQVKVDNKSKIKDDPNLWCQEHKDPKYILNLLLSIITLSLKTNELVKKLPKVEF